MCPKDNILTRDKVLNNLIYGLFSFCAIIYTSYKLLKLSSFWPTR